jgi:cytochrome c553
MLARWLPTVAALIVGLSAVTLIEVPGETAAFEPPQWAYTYKEIKELFAPPTAYRAVYSRMPAVVARGREPVVQACASCHLANGLGRPESSSLAGLTVDYMELQLADFKSGARHSSVGESPMAPIARALTPEERAAALAYYSKLPRAPWITVVEADSVPKTRTVENGMRIPVLPEELEPLGQRIIELPKDPTRARLYDSQTPFIAYVPKGSIRRGRAFVLTGGTQTIGGQVIPGKAVACANCHGVTLKGMAHAPDSDVPVPSLVGRSPTYLLRQLYDVHSGARSAKSTEMMKPIAAQMTLQQMIDAAAYLGSKAP